jgi:hypothetical protein
MGEEINIKLLEENAKRDHLGHLKVDWRLILK